ncbi:PTS transporter subunit EIIC [Marinilactibacillus sp. XAAS-LB27]|uniref:PTS sugar transporter subunit IIC n=1 Tax=Marinilactibacillus sp. XAAS-LB27 TaxID=3114538 RepID=UPI002E188C0A|nr:PTS transporter subunit EIIC [Marinilactibacillus sp. XAAS-LB27]
MKERSEGFLDKTRGLTEKISRNIYLQAVSESMMSILGLMIFGSIIIIFQAFPIASVAEFFANVGLTPIFATINTFTIGSISLYLVFLITRNLVKKLLKEDGVAAGIMGLMFFLILTPLGDIVLEESSVRALPVTWIGTSGMFTAIIVGLFVGRGYTFVKEKNWTIKMPEGVPPMVSQTFEALIPTFLLGTIAGMIAWAFSLTGLETFHQMIFQFIQTPLQSVGSSIWAVAAIIAFQQLLWFLGMHGTNIIAPVVTPLWLSLNLQNLEAFQAGQPLPHIVTASFVNIICWSGSVFGLALLMNFAKSKRYKEMGRLAIVPAAFGITEPVIFGTPLVLNFKMAIPFITNNSIALLLAYFVTNIGLVERVIGAQAIFGLPLGFHASVGGHWTIIVMQIVIHAVLSPILWYPWFKRIDNEAYALEANLENNK